MSNRRKNAQNCWIFEVTCWSDEACHLLLPFPVLRSLRLLRSSRSLRSLQTLRTIRSIRSIRVQKQNVGFVFRLVYSFANARCVGV